MKSDQINTIDKYLSMYNLFNFTHDREFKHKINKLEETFFQKMPANNEIKRS